MTKQTMDRPLSDMTLSELRDIIRDVIREEGFSRWRIDKDGNIVFLFEEDYEKYLTEQKDKLPGEVKAYFIDEQGFTVRYADEIPSTRTRRRIEKAKQEIAEGKGLSLEEFRQRLSSK